MVERADGGMVDAAKGVQLSMIKRGRGGGLLREFHCLWRDYLLISIRPGGLTPRRPLSNSLTAKVASRRAGYAQSSTATAAAAKASVRLRKWLERSCGTYGGAAPAVHGKIGAVFKCLGPPHIGLQLPCPEVHDL